MPINILDAQARYNEIGRIRLGIKKKSEKTGGTYPTKLDTFRLTSKDKHALDEAARLYGGEVVPREGTPGEFDLITESTEIPIFLPSAALSQWMELWSGGGCARRCDGDNEVISGEPCICKRLQDAAGDAVIPKKDLCSPHTRLSVIIPDIPGVGVWRLESTGWNAAHELASSVKILKALASGMSTVPAFLALEQREDKVDGKTTKFPVAVIRIRVSMNELRANPMLSMESGAEVDRETGELSAPKAALPQATILPPETPKTTPGATTPAASYVGTPPLGRSAFGYTPQSWPSDISFERAITASQKEQVEKWTVVRNVENVDQFCENLMFNYKLPYPETEQGKWAAGNYQLLIDFLRLAPDEAITACVEFN